MICAAHRYRLADGLKGSETPGSCGRVGWARNVLVFGGKHGECFV